MISPAPDDLDDSTGGRIEGWADWSGRVREVLALAAKAPASLLMLDINFDRWPLGEVACVQCFEQWALNHRHGHCTLVAQDWRNFAQHHPRWLRWRAAWSHKVHCKSIPEEELSSLQSLRPILVLEGGMGVQMLDPESGRGLWSRRPSTLMDWWRLGDAISQRSIEAMPVTTVGL